MSYRIEVQQAAEAVRREYMRGDEPLCGGPACYPMRPVDYDPKDYGEAEGPALCEYIELTIPGRGTFLAILTRVEVEGGPGMKFHAKPIGQ